MSNIPYTALGKESLDILSILKLNRHETANLIESMADNMTPEKALLLLDEIIKNNPLDGGMTHFDRIIFTIRQAYITGVATAISSYSNAIELVVRESANTIKDDVSND